MADVVAMFSGLNVWRRGDERAPHKPLLVLYALGRWQRGDRQVSFPEVDRDVGRLLREFGPPRKTTPVYPFCRLESDGVWRVDAPDDVVRRSGDKEPLVSELRRLDASAGFTPDVAEALDADPAIAARIARRLLDSHFPETLHGDIIQAIGLELGTYTTTRRKRDPTFRPRILEVYGHRCCVCGFDARLGAATVGIDAAHIRWHQAGGPDIEGNGMALCALHHKTFDLGAFTVDPGLVVLVSNELEGSEPVERAVHDHHGREIRAPEDEASRPDSEFLLWHRREVFRGPPRNVG